MKQLYKYIKKIHPHYEGPDVVERNRHLKHVGGQWFPGLPKRPHLLSDGADEAIVYNLDKFYSETSNVRTSCIKMVPDYTGIKIQKATLDSDVLRLQSQLEEIRLQRQRPAIPQVRRRLRTKTKPEAT